MRLYDKTLYAKTIEEKRVVACQIIDKVISKSFDLKEKEILDSVMDLVTQLGRSFGCNVLSTNLYDIFIDYSNDVFNFDTLVELLEKEKKRIGELVEK